jgi:hypothetical protein
MNVSEELSASILRAEAEHNRFLHNTDKFLPHYRQLSEQTAE